MKVKFLSVALIYAACPALAQERQWFGLGEGFYQNNSRIDPLSLSAPVLSGNHSPIEAATWHVSADFGAVYLASPSDTPPRSQQIFEENRANSSSGFISTDSPEIRLHPYIKLTVNFQF